MNQNVDPSPPQYQISGSPPAKMLGQKKSKTDFTVENI